MTVLIVLTYDWMTRTLFSYNERMAGFLFLIGVLLLKAHVATSQQGIQAFFTMASYYACYLINAFIVYGCYIRLRKGEFSGKHIAMSVIGIALSFGTGMQSLRQTAVMALPLVACEKIEEDNALLCPMLDARRMEVYAQIFDRGLKEKRGIQADIVDADTYKEYLDHAPVYFFGNGAEKCMETIAHANAKLIKGIEPLAKNMFPLAEKRIAMGQYEDVAYFVPFYLKDFVAKQPKKLL